MKFFAFLFSILFVYTASHAAQIRFEGAVKVKRGAGGFDELKQGQTVELKDGESLFALPERGIPVVVYLPASSSAELTVTDGDLRTALGAELRPVLETSTSEIVNGLRKAESLMQRKSYEQALSIVGDLNKKYPRISAVLFLSGTIHYLLNDKATAIDELSSGLQLDPQNEPAKKLLERLKGKS